MIDELYLWKLSHKQRLASIFLNKLTSKIVIIIGTVFIFLSSGCSLLHPAAVNEPNLYTLNYVPNKITGRQHTNLSLLVMPTDADPALTDQDMLYSRKPHEINHFSKNSWVAAPPKMLTSLITRTLQDSGYYKAVIMAPFSGDVDLRLYTHLYQMQQEFLYKPSIVRISLAAQLVNANTGKIKAAKQFQLIEVAPQNNPYGGVVAMNHAVSKLIQQILKFCMQHS